MQITKKECDFLIKSTIESLQEKTVAFKISAYLLEDIDKMKSQLHRLWELVEAYDEMEDL